jgi:hypothetical protein
LYVDVIYLHCGASASSEGESFYIKRYFQDLLWHK